MSHIRVVTVTQAALVMPFLLSRKRTRILGNIADFKGDMLMSEKKIKILLGGTKRGEFNFLW